MRNRALAVGMLVGGLLALPASALGHGAHVNSELSDAEQHRATDLAGVAVPTLERRVEAAARQLGHQPGDASASRTALAAAAVEPDLGGSWSAVKPVAVVPIFAALLPNGKVLMWDSVGDNAAETYDDQTFTRAAVYDPVTDTSKRVDVTGSNIFCAGFVQLANGNVFVAGGNADRALNGIRRTHTFDWRTETWTRGPDMQDGRWYPSVAALPNDEAVIVGGGPTVAEVRTSSGGLRRLTGFTTPSSRDYPFLQAAPDGRALLLGPSPAMSLIDWTGAGAIAAFAARDGINRGYGSYAAYDIGRYLVAGGGSVSEDGATGPSRTASVVDTRGAGPAARPTGSMTYRRRQSNLTVLADGSALVTGGQSTGAGGGLVDLANAVYAAERWDPATDSWSTLNSAAVARQYHSTALLLPDGRVLTGGGGICGECDRVRYLRKDVELFTPPYLYGPDGQLAPRPQISAAPATIGYDGAFTASSPQADQIAKLGLVRLGAPTHGQDQGQRYVPLSFTTSGMTLAVTAPNNPNEAPPGHYMMFAVDAAGVPSMASMVEVKRQAVAAPPAAVNLALGRPATGSTPCATSEGPAKAVNGSVSGGWSDKWCSKISGNRSLRVDLGSSRSVTTFVVKHASAGGEPSSMNTRAYRIETSTNGSSWSTAVTVGANTAGVTTSTVTARTARYVRLVVTASEQGTAAGAARIYELEVYAGGAAVTPPAPAVAYADLNASGRAQRFEAGQYELGRGNLSQLGNDAARSLDVAPGYQATICGDTGMAGGCTTLGAGRYNTLPSGYDRTLSSLRVRPVP